jgi:XTP/dITP diphosphohydrolase
MSAAGSEPHGGTTLLVATTNPGKLREILPHFAGLGLEIKTLGDFPGVPEPHEPAATFWENARIKALSYAASTRVLTVAEDSGLEIDALGGAPGVQSARFLGADVSYPERFAEIHRRLKDVPARERSARFITALALASDGELLFETETAIEGLIADEPLGTDGFGYDPIFFYPPLGCTAGRMTLNEKAAVSHRARAFRDLARYLRARPLLNS